MIVFKSIEKYLKHRKEQGSICYGFVPTMGALHEGHLSLIKEAKKTTKRVCVSIFVNPTQFNNPQDLQTYPSNIELDLEKLKQLGVDEVILPSYKEIYPDNYRYKISENDFSKKLCGKYREGHFDGVLTIVMKLLNIVRPEKAFFGKKDFQQYQLIKDMCHAFFMQIEILGLETVREESGLAMSSRNQRLSSNAKQTASNIFKILTESSSANEARESLLRKDFVIDYVEDIANRRYAAVTLEGVRLIDNVEITNG